MVMEPQYVIKLRGEYLMEVRTLMDVTITKNKSLARKFRRSVAEEVASWWGADIEPAEEPAEVLKYDDAEWVLKALGTIGHFQTYADKEWTQEELAEWYDDVEMRRKASALEGAIHHLARMRHKAKTDKHFEAAVKEWEVKLAEYADACGLRVN